MRIGQTHQKDREVRVPYFQTDDESDACIVVAGLANHRLVQSTNGKKSLVIPAFSLIRIHEKKKVLFGRILASCDRPSIHILPSTNESSVPSDMRILPPVVPFRNQRFHSVFELLNEDFSSSSEMVTFEPDPFLDRQDEPNQHLVYEP